VVGVRGRRRLVGEVEGVAQSIIFMSLPMRVVSSWASVTAANTVVERLGSKVVRSRARSFQPADRRGTLGGG
jgi:hypothetical protein